MTKPNLIIQNLNVSVEGKAVLQGLSLTLKPSEIHVLMGPNGSGKSTLANTLMGHPQYKVLQGSACLGRQDILKLKPNERAKLGLFLAFQHPLEVPGVRLGSFLRAAYNTLHNKQKLSPAAFRKNLHTLLEELDLEPSFLERNLNEGFSGGEKKKAEVLQMRALGPSIIICDEIDSGLDVDALKLVAQSITQVVSKGASVLVITHYQRLLKYLQPQKVSIMSNGKIVACGGPELVKEIEENGYADLQ